MKIDRGVYLCALDHILKKGDTDIFPYPFELKFLNCRRDQVADQLSSIDLQKYHPMSLVEALVPKGRFGFRVAHQSFPIDTVIYTALVLSIADAVEAGRDPKENNRAFSYRKIPGLDSEFFLPDRTYKNWLDSLMGKVFSDEYASVVRTDISDYYLRIYRHRLENILESLSGDSRVVANIKRFLSDWRGGQSFGLPVGTNASRFLAEAALNDTNFALIAEGIEHTRFVDDVYIFVRKDQDAYAALAFLARQLSENEGLSINSHKTKIMSWADFISTMGAPDSEDDDSKEEFATEKLFSRL